MPASRRACSSLHRVGHTAHLRCRGSRSPISAQAPAGDQQKVELVGSWTMINDEERLIRIDPGPELGNFTGFPLNAAGKLKALTWNSTIQAIPEHQSRPHAGSYSMRG